MFILLEISFQDVVLIITGFVIMFLVICCAANSPANSEESNDKHSSRDDRDYIDKMIELEMMGVLDDDDF